LTYPTAGSPATLPDEERQSPVRAPYLGEHTDEVLLEVLKLSSSEVGRLHDKNIVADKKIQ
jgi:2-methylfumaryl-CoA isomerase